MGTRQQWGFGVAVCTAALLAAAPVPGASPTASSCTRCHEKYKDAPSHQMVTGDPCLFCHGKHDSGSPKKGDKVATKACSSDGCHAQKVAARSDLVRHEPFAFGWCTMCHEHGSSFLKPPVDTQIALCLNCHDRKVTPAPLPGQPAAAVSTHPPKGKGSIACTFCHHHHESPKTFEVVTADGTAKVPNPKRLTRPERQLCQQCHKTVGAHHIAPNGAMVEERYARARDIPCSTCHEAHFAAYPDLLKSGRSKAEMCVTCHKAPR